MAILPEPTLAAEALRHTGELMAKIVVGTTSYDRRPPAFEWNEKLQRYVHSESMVVWRDEREIEIVVSHDGRVLRFDDPARLEGAAQRRLDEATLMAIAKTTGLVGEAATLSRVQPGALYRYRVLQPTTPRAIDFVVNPRSRLVARFEVVA